MPDPPSKFAALLSELRQRRVFRVAAVYACMAFIIFQIVDATFEPLRLPDWASTLVVVLLALGFPVAVGMAWAFDLTAEGLVRAKVKREPTAAKAPHHVIIGNKTLAVIALLAVIAAAWTLLREPSPGGAISSIAVLPFINMSADPEQEYFCDGMAEEIINGLTHVENLRVIARTSTFAFKGEKIDIRKIGEQLNVESILEGSVRKAGNRVRISAQLINVADFSHLWSERYDREMEDIFDIQDEISLAIVDNLKIKLLGKEKAAIVKRHTEDLEAYNMYLMGRYYWNKRNEEGYNRAFEYFRKALDKDPNYALAYAGIADTYSLKGFYGYLYPKDAYPKAKAAAEKALLLDNKIAEAHATLAWINLSYYWDWPATESEFKQALQLNPNYAMALHWYAMYLSAMGRSDEAIMEIKQAQELDPLSLQINALVGCIFYRSRKYDEALEQLNMTLEIDPNFPMTYWYLGMVHYAKSMWDEAIKADKKFVDFSGGSPLALGALGAAYAASGQKDEALEMLNQLDELSKERYVSPFYRAYIYTGLEDNNQAFEYLEKAYNEREPLLAFIKDWPFCDSLSPDPRFKAFLKKMGL